LSDIQSGVQHGVILSSDAQILKAEILKIDQDLISIGLSIKSQLKALSELTSLTIPDNKLLKIPHFNVRPDVAENSRIEYKILELQQDRLLALKEQTNAKYLPKAYGFGQLGYGRPGLNMLSNDFEPYLYVGAKLNWNVWNWNKGKREKEILSLNYDIVDKQKETFEKNLKISVENSIAEIQKLEQMILKDNEIIDLRSSIAQTALSQYDNGIINSSDYLNELNKETEAKLNLRLHKIQLELAKLNYLSIIGKL